MQENSPTPDDVARAFEQLRLVSIARKFPEAYREAVAKNLGTLELIGMLLEEELAGRKQRRFERLVAAGNLDMDDCLERYDFELARSRGVDPRAVRDLASCAYIEKGQNIILAGAVGTGKTHLARMLALEAIRRDYRAVFEVTRELIENLYQTRNAYTFPKIYRAYVTAPVLVLDDLAYMSFKPDMVEFLFRLVFDRVERQTGSIIVTTNTDVQEWWQFFPSKAMGMAFSDRVLGGAYGIKFSGPSIRGGPDQDKK